MHHSIRKSRAGGEKRHEAIARDLLARLRDPSLTRLPTIRELARQYRASSSTISRAVGLLAATGQVEAGPGRGIVRPGLPGDTAAEPDPVSAVGRFASLLERRISDGTYQVGRPLPKFEYFVRNEGVSRDTVHGALRLLAERKLVTKSGRAWIVGPRDRPHWSDRGGSVTVRSAERRVCLVLVQQTSDWEHAGSSERTRRFAETFQSEVDKNGMNMRLALGPVSLTPIGFPSGREQIGETIDGLGRRYGGSLVAMTPRHVGAALSWAEWLATYRRPVVLFDPVDTLPEPRERWPGRANVFRCHFSEVDGVDAALMALASYGHRVLGIPNHVREYRSWVARRIALLRKQVDRHDLGMSIVDRNRPVEIKPFPKREALAWLRRRSPGGMVHPEEAEDDRTAARSVSRVTQHLSDCIHVVAPLLRHRGVTAMVIPNDAVAVRVYYALLALGVRVPEDLSLVSFDNSAVASGIPVSTVDFGFDYLGYCAAHLLIGDIPIRSDRAGNLAARSRLVDRGSVGPAREGRLDVALPPVGR